MSVTASVPEQLDRLVELGLTEIAGTSPAELTRRVQELPDEPSGVLVVHPSLVPASRLTPLLARAGKSGFVVTEMTDLDEFAPIDGLDVPDAPLYLVHDVTRGDDLRDWSPDEALPELARRGRTPLTVNEGVSWLLQQPDQLEPNHCFMTIGSRKRKPRGLDSRTPAIWISGGTGRDGRENAGAPKVGWCWAGNRHTWLGFASASSRTG